MQAERRPHPMTPDLPNPVPGGVRSSAGLGDGCEDARVKLGRGGTEPLLTDGGELLASQKLGGGTLKEARNCPATVDAARISSSWTTAPE